MNPVSITRRGQFCHRGALGATIVAAMCFALSGWQYHLLPIAITLTLLRAGLNVLASRRAGKHLPDRYSDMLLVAGIAVSSLTHWHWPVIALGSMLLAAVTGALSHVPGLDGKPFGPTGVIARLVSLVSASICHWVFLTFNHTPWTIAGHVLEPMAVGTALVSLLAQVTVLAHVLTLLRRETDLESRVDETCRTGGGLFAADRRPHADRSWPAAVIVLVLAAGLLGGCHVDTPVTDFPHVMETEPQSNADYWIFVPTTYRDWKPAPVIVSCHGTIPFDTANMHIREWKDLAQRYGCIVICPVLRGTDGILGSGAVSAMLEDERRILAILSRVGYDYNIDRANVMITGFSGGGFPTYFVGLRYPDVFTTVVARNCNFSKRNLDGWYPDRARRTPVMVYWGSVDPPTIIIQSHNAVRYLRGKGFRVTTDVLPGVGHERHPKVAMRFFLRHRNRPVPSLETRGFRVIRPPGGPKPIGGPAPDPQR